MQRFKDWLREFVTDRPRRAMTFGIIGISQEQMVDLVKSKPVMVWDADGGWKVTGLEQDIFVPFNQPFKFPGRDTIIVQRSLDLEKVLDRMEAGYPGEDRY